MADEIIEIIKIDIDFDKAITDIIEYKKRIATLKSELADYKSDEEKLSKEYIQKSAQLKGLNNEVRALENMTAKLTTANELQGVSIQKLQAENAKLYAEQKKLNLLDEEQLKRNEEINNTINVNTELIKEHSSKLAQDKMNVGNYTESIKQAMDGVGGFNASLTNNVSVLIEMSQQEGGLKAVFATMIAGFKGAARAALAFLATPIGLVLAGIALAVSAVSNALSKNRDVMNSVSDVWAGFSGALSAIEAQTNKTVNGFVKLFSKDWKQGILDIAEGVVKLSNNFTGLNKEMNESIDAAVKLNQLQREIEKNRINQILSIAELSKKEKELELIADDNTRSLKERTAANEQLILVKKQLAKTELEIRKQEEMAAKAVLDEEKKKTGFIQNETLKSYNEAKARRIQAESEANQITAEGSKKRREIALEETERKLDFLIDGYDAVKTANEKIVANDKITFDIRQKALDETRIKGDETFKKQIETVEKFHKIRLDGEKLMQIADAETLYNQVKASGVNDVLAGRLLEIYRERKLALSDLAEAEQGLNEAKAVAAVEQLDYELKVWQSNNKSKLESAKILTSELITEENNRLIQETNLQLDALTVQKEKLLITENDYNIKAIDLKNSLDENIKNLNLTFEQQERDRKISQLQTDYENQKVILEGNGLALLELEAKQLDYKRDLEIQAAEKNGANVLLIDKKYSKAKKEIARAELSAKLSLASSFAQNIATIAGEQTAIGKAAAVASTTINTIEGAQAAYTGMVDAIPGPVGIIAGVVAAAASVALGLSNVKKILAVKSGLPGDGGSIGSGLSSIGGSGTASVPVGVNDVNPLIGQGIVTRNQIELNNDQASLQPTLVIEDVTKAQSAQLAQNKTSVI